MQAHAVHGARVDDPVPLPIKRPARAAPPSCTDALVSQAHVVVGRLVAARLQPLTHAREEGALGLGLARQLDERGLERVERQVDVEVALVVVSVGLAEPVVDDVLGALPVGRHRAQIGPDLLASEPPLDGEGCLLPQRRYPARVGLVLGELGELDRRVVGKDLNLERDEHVAAVGHRDQQVVGIALQAEAAVRRRDLLPHSEAGLDGDIFEGEVAIVGGHVVADALVAQLRVRTHLGLPQEGLHVGRPAGAQLEQRVAHPRRVVARATRRALRPLALALLRVPA
mmetsp:Transcript_42000/g.115967  ORF Transcript_42000/g.115967 Transcript_42000/m.115967 type:complete len:284 (+) Transcript_42000:231-1082(+)